MILWCKCWTHLVFWQSLHTGYATASPLLVFCHTSLFTCVTICLICSYVCLRLCTSITSCLFLSFWKVFQIVYCLPFTPSKYDDYKDICEQFVTSVANYMPQFSKRLKVHLLLHLVDDMIQFGPASCFNTERYMYVRCILSQWQLQWYDTVILAHRKTHNMFVLPVTCYSLSVTW